MSEPVEQLPPEQPAAEPQAEIKPEAESFLERTISPEARQKLTEFGHSAEEAAKKALHRADEMADQAVGKIKATLNDNERNEKIAQEAKELAAKAGEATRQGIIKGADAIKRAAEDPEAAKLAVKAAVTSRWDKIKGVFSKEDEPAPTAPPKNPEEV